MKAGIPILWLAQIGSAVRSLLEAEWERGTAFLFLPVALASGALFYFQSANEPSLAVMLAWPVVFLLAGWLCRTMRPLFMLLMALAISAFGGLAAKLETTRLDTRMLGSEVTTRLTGRIVQIERRANRSVRLTIDVVKTARPSLRYQPDRVRLTARKMASDLHIGDIVEGPARLRSPPGPVRPDSYDFSFANYFHGLGANGFFLGAPSIRGPPSDSDLLTELTEWLANFRDSLTQKISSTIGGSEGAIAAALITGSKAGIPNEVNEALRRTGLAHILSISGLHMALVTGFVMVVMRSGFALFPNFASHYPVKKISGLVALLFAFFYFLISGAGVASQRSFLMLCVMLLALQFDRAAITRRNLAIAAILIIVLSPHEVLAPGFQMSFAATAALIAAYEAWSTRRAARQSPDNAKRQGFLPLLRRYLAGLAFTSLIAGGATAIYAAFHFQRIAPLSLVANLAAMPVVSTVVMPFAVIGMALMPLGLESAPFRVMASGIAAVTAIAEWLSEKSHFDSVGIVPPAALLLATVALALATLLSTRLVIAAIPIGLAAIAVFSLGKNPDMLISEDARLIAVRTDNGSLAINRSRPNKFTIDHWKLAMRSDTVVKPGQDEPDSNSFQCNDEGCSYHHATGVTVWHIGNKTVTADLCARATVIVTESATTGNPCPSTVTVVSKRELARRGSASIRFQQRGKDPRPDIQFAVDSLNRPWHAQRQFSRAARGLAPWKITRPRKTPAAQQKVQQAQ